MIAFHNTFGGFTELEGVVNAGNWALGGAFRGLTNPVMYYDTAERATYALGYESNIYNNKVWIVKQKGRNVTSAPVNNGTDGPEPLNHPTPLLHFDTQTGYIYVIQNEFHVDRFGVWKSDNPRDITSFTFVDWFDNNGSYLVTIDDADTNSMWFVTRSGDSSPADGYDQSILNVDLDNPSAYVKTVVTDTNYNTTNIRHYNNGAYFYGTSDYRVCCINHRSDTNPITNYKVSLWLKKLDDDVAYSFDLAFSKDVVANGVLTPAELEANYKYLGNDSALTTTYATQDMVQIDNTLYMITRKETEYYVDKLAIGTSYTPTDSILLGTTANLSINRIFNYGTKLLLIIEVDNVAKLYTLDFDLTTLTFIRSFDAIPDGSYCGLPVNMLDVRPNDKFLVIGRSLIDGIGGNVPYHILKGDIKV